MSQLVKTQLFLSAITALLALNNPARLLAQSLHRLPITTAQELHDYFNWKPGKPPIISGHRGGMHEGFAENSLSSFEHTLEHTPAFFETDPRLTKDSVVVLLHDATLDRMTTGTGKLSDYTWEEVKKLRLKDAQGRVTQDRIPSLDEAIDWARGKTVLNLDHKEVPLSMTAAIIRKHKADAFVMLTVHSPQQAQYYYRENKDRMFSAFIKNKDEWEAYEKAGIPASSLIAYIGPTVKPDNKQLYQLLNSKGIMCMISAASSYDKLADEQERFSAYRAIIEDGASILESDRPIDVAQALKRLRTNQSPSTSAPTKN